MGCREYDASADEYEESIIVLEHDRSTELAVIDAYY